MKDVDTLIKLISLSKHLGLFPDEEAALLRILARHEAATEIVADALAPDLVDCPTRGLADQEAFRKLSRLFAPDSEGI